MNEPDMSQVKDGRSFVDSTGDDRTVNNVARHEYRVLSDNEKTDVKAIKDAGAEFLRNLETVGSHYPEGSGPRRELALAKTKTEEAIMWAVRGITA